MKKQSKITGHKGDITFFTQKGEAFQKMNGVFTSKVKNGKMAYMPVKIINGLHIKYNSNGLYGFGIFSGKKGKKRIQDNIWTLLEAEKLAKSFAAMKTESKKLAISIILKPPMKMKGSC